MKHHLSKKFPAKRAFITGSGSGLGLALCKELASDGWTIGMSDIDGVALKKASDEISKLGGNPLSYGLDVSDKDQYRIVAKKFLAETGGIDLL
jgi:NAD(P)-dependent dehydrogenase (short-subunit alcohol dehydrogenase family)